MQVLAKNRLNFIGMSCLGIGCLVGAFGYPLQKLEVYKQLENGSFGTRYERTFVLTESDTNQPYGFDRKRARKVAFIYSDYKLQKSFLLIMAGICSGYALYIGGQTCQNAEIDSEVDQIRAKGRRELIVERVKHSLAMSSKAQRLLFLDEMKALIEEFGSAEAERMEADELTALYGETDEQETEDQPTFREHFDKSLDAASWKAVAKALTAGASREEIVSDVLSCRDLGAGLQYIDFLEASLGEGTNENS